MDGTIDNIGSRYLTFISQPAEPIPTFRPKVAAQLLHPIFPRHNSLVGPLSSKIRLGLTMDSNNSDRLTRRFKRYPATVWRFEIWCGIAMGSMGIGFTVYLMGHPSNCAINMLSLGDNISRNLLQNVEHTSKQRGPYFFIRISIYSPVSARFPLFLHILTKPNVQSKRARWNG